MKTKELIVLLTSSLLVPFTILGQGALTPPGAPAPTMITLSQIEPRTPISSVPYTISTPGSYYLTTNLIAPSGSTTIFVNTNGVTIDLNGFTISSSGSGGRGAGIFLIYGTQDITILNGHIEGGVTNNGTNVYSGPGFNSGIYANGPVQNVRISGVSVSGVLDYGIYLATGTSTVEGCVVHTVGNYGIFATTVKSCTASDCGSTAIAGDVVSDSHGDATGSGSDGIYANYAVQNSYGYATNDNGSGVICHGEVLNSYGWGGGSGYGILADEVENSHGYNTGSGIGLEVFDTAHNCDGYSATGAGVVSGIAESCYGQSASGTGVSAITALNCYGYVTPGGTNSTAISSRVTENCYALNYGGGFGIYTTLAFNCYAYCASGTGLGAMTANSCNAVTTSGTAYNVSHNVNSY